MRAGSALAGNRGGVAQLLLCEGEIEYPGSGGRPEIGWRGLGCSTAEHLFGKTLVAVALDCE